MEFEPSLNLSFTNDESSIGLHFLVTPNIILTDLAPMDARRRRDPASMMATSATICAGVGGGVWIEGTSGYGYEQNDHAGGALTAGISTRTNLGRTTLIRAKAQFIYLLPSGSVFTEARSIFQIGVGFGVFVRY
jgi:hypothetical protein